MYNTCRALLVPRGRSYTDPSTLAQTSCFPSQEHVARGRTVERDRYTDRRKANTWDASQGLCGGVSFVTTLANKAAPTISRLNHGCSEHVSHPLRIRRCLQTQRESTFINCFVEPGSHPVAAPPLNLQPDKDNLSPIKIGLTITHRGTSCELARKDRPRID